jgi:serine protease Do
MRRNGASNFARTALALCAIGLSISLSPRASADPLAESIHSEITRLFELHRNAVVRVRASDALGVRLGSGFFVDPSGTVYTHSGIVMKADDISVNFQGRTLPARIIASDPRTGIALLKTECISPFIPVGNSDHVGNATPVIAIGFPREFEAGYGGAPVVDFNGKVIGIVAARIGQGGSCYILPIGAAEKIRRDIARFGELRPGWIGVEVEDASDAVDGSTARVVTMMPDTPAAKFGLHKGDILLGVNGRKVCSIQDLVDAAYYLTAGEEAKIQITREGRQMDIPVMPVLHPSAAVTEMRADSGMPHPN